MLDKLLDREKAPSFACFAIIRGVRHYSAFFLPLGRVFTQPGRVIVATSLRWPDDSSPSCRISVEDAGKPNAFKKDRIIARHRL